MELLLDDLASWRQGSREIWLFFSKERLLPTLLPLLLLRLLEPAIPITSYGSRSFTESLSLREAYGDLNSISRLSSRGTTQVGTAYLFLRRDVKLTTTEEAGLVGGCRFLCFPL